jgi:hypothetical protein
MKSRIIIILTSLLCTSPAYASHIDATSLYSLHAIASVTGSTGNWKSYNGSSVDTISDLSDFSNISDVVSNGANDAVVFNSFVWSEDDADATITLGFGTDTVGNQPGNDLAIFSVGPATLDVTISEITVRHSSSSIEIGGALQGVYSNNSPPAYLDTLDVILINLDAYSDVSRMNQLTIDTLTVAENPLVWPGISAVGAFNTTPAVTFNTSVVPLPLPIILFGSGLALLGLLGRKNTKDTM